jgi:hypothetical protein
VRSEKVAGLIQKDISISVAWLMILGWGVGAKSTIGIRNFNLLRSQVRRRKRVV